MELNDDGVVREFTSVLQIILKYESPIQIAAVSCCSRQDFCIPCFCNTSEAQVFGQRIDVRRSLC